MARYGVNVQRVEPVKESSTDEATAAPAEPSKYRSALLVSAYAIAVAITPEFTFLGIPKVRLTDLLMPFLMFSYLGNVGQQKPKYQSARSLCTLLMLWDLGALFLWGSAKPTPGLFYLAKRLIYFLVALFASGCVRSKSAWQSILRTLVFTSPVLSYFCLRELRVLESRGGVYASVDGLRASGIIANQQTSTALFLVIVVCLIMGAMDAFKDFTWKIFSFVSLCAGCAAVFSTGSRGGMACLALSVVVFCFLNPAKIGKALAATFIVGMGAWIATPGQVQARLAAIFPETQATVSGLLGDQEAMPESGSSSVADRAMTASWFFKEIMPQAGLLGMGAGWKGLGAIDNCYLSEWMYHGVIGLLIFIRMQWFILIFCLKAAKEGKDPGEKGVASGVATAVIVMCASCIHGDTFYLIRPMECLALLIGLVAARRGMSR